MSEKALSALESLILIPDILCSILTLWTFLFGNRYCECFNIIDGDFRFTDYFCFSSDKFSIIPFFSWFRQCLLKIKTSPCWVHFQENQNIFLLGTFPRLASPTNSWALSCRTAHGLQHHSAWICETQRASEKKCLINYTDGLNIGILVSKVPITFH